MTHHRLIVRSTSSTIRMSAQRRKSSENNLPINLHDDACCFEELDVLIADFDLTTGVQR